MELEQLHAAALAELTDKIHAAPAVKALCPEQVFGPDDEAQAAEWSRCVVVRPGRNYGTQNKKRRLLVQRDAKVEFRAESLDVLNMLARAVVLAVNGAVGQAGFKQCVHTNSGPASNEKGHWERTDVFGLHCVQAAEAEEVKAMEAVRPPTRVTGIPAANPPKKGD